MVLLLHIITALTSVIYTTYLLVFPSRFKMHISYGLIALTLLSGTYLVWRTHAPLLQSCLTGFIYIAVVSTGLAAARYRLGRNAGEQLSDS